MNFDELQAHWQLLDKKIDQLLSNQGALEQRLTLDRVHKRTNWMFVWMVLDLLFAFAVLLWAGSCAANVWPQFTAVLPSVVLMGGALCLLISSVRQLEILSRIEWDAPVASIQVGLARLSAFRVFQFKWIMLTAPLMGFIALLVGFRWCSGVDMFERFDRNWIFANLVFGGLAIPLGLMAARYFSSRHDLKAFWKRVSDDIAGHSLTSAREELARWNDFVNTPNP
jgi:hypothetical protein